MDLELIVDGVMKCYIKKQPQDFEKPDTILDTNYKEMLQKWPKKNASKVPVIFLHKPANFKEHVRKILSMKIGFYQPTLSRNFTKISCVSHNDQKSIIKYFEKKKLPFHTYGNPSKRKIKIVIKGLPKDTALDKIKAELKSADVPIIRVHKMETKENDSINMMVLAVVPYDQKGLALLGLRRLLGHNVTLEPPRTKLNQCYRCQKWGHTERYCYGDIKCVKCAGDHLYKKCTRDNETTDPPKCANCGGTHTANYKKCPKSPFSTKSGTLIIKQTLADIIKPPPIKPILVTKGNCDNLYKKKKAKFNENITNHMSDNSRM